MQARRVPSGSKIQYLDCSSCGQSFSGMAALANHEFTCGGMDYGPTTDKQYRVKSSMGGQKNIFSSASSSQAKEKAISCSVCLVKIPVSQLRSHELDCRSKQLTKKGGNQRITGGGGSMNPRKPTVSRKEPEPVYEPTPVIRRPKTLMCYICGREYGTKSLPIHLKSCEQKWDIEQANKPAKDRRPMPRPPPGIVDLLAKDSISSKDIQNYNNRAFDQYNYDVLVPCNSCGRTFKPESLIPHQKSCKPNNPLKPMSKMQQDYKMEMEYAAQNGNLNLVSCRKCGRNFASDRISKHESVCKPGPTKQALKKQKQRELLEQKMQRNDRRYDQAAKSSNWRQQHEEFISSMKYMRQVKAAEAKGGNIRNMPPPPKSTSYNNSNLKQCPNCLRKFNDEAADRHIKVCKNIIAKPKPPPSVLKSTKQYSAISSNMSHGFEDDDFYMSPPAKVSQKTIRPPSYASSSMTSPQKTYKIMNSNVSSSMSGGGQFSTKLGDRDSWMKQMGTKQQKTHDNLYGIGNFSNNQVSNNSAFPAPKGYGGRGGGGSIFG